MGTDASADFLPEDEDLPAAPAPAAAAATLRLGPELTIAFAAATRELLADALGGSGDREIDLGGVSDIDSAGLQLLLAARRGLTERGDALRITAASAAVLEALSVFGLQSLLIAPVEAAGA